MTALDTAGYADVPGYIYGCTREIWEDRGVGPKLDRYYAPDCTVRAPSGVTIGVADVRRDTLATIHQFPDRQLVGEDVIWKPTGSGSFLSSHRLISVMHHRGSGRWGAASGRLVKARVIADCWVQDGRITEEWLIRDGAAFARCLGVETRALAAAQRTGDRAAGRAPALFRADDDRPSRYRPAIADDPAVAHAVAAMTAIWNERNLAAIRDVYHAGAAVHAPANETCNGHGEIDAFVAGVLAALPDARFAVHDATVLREAEAPVRVALRWSLDGTHRGWGRFGEPTGAALHVMGLSHLHLSQGRIVSEWTLFDELAVWTQILDHSDT